MSIEEAAKLIVAGEPVHESTAPSDKPGRPKTIYTVGEIELNRADYVKANKIAQTSEVQLDAAMALIKSMDEAEFAENARLALPALLDRAIKLAMRSDDIKQVMAVAKELADRGYGKVAKIHDTSDKAEMVRLGWGAMPGYQTIDVEDDG